jgi:hypothetical protein
MIGVYSKYHTKSECWNRLLCFAGLSRPKFSEVWYGKSLQSAFIQKDRHCFLLIALRKAGVSSLVGLRCFGYLWLNCSIPRHLQAPVTLRTHSFCVLKCLQHRILPAFVLIVAQRRQVDLRFLSCVILSSSQLPRWWPAGVRRNDPLVVRYFRSVGRVVHTGWSKSRAAHIKIVIDGWIQSDVDDTGCSI